MSSGGKLAFRAQNFHILVPFIAKLLIIWATPLLLSACLLKQGLRDGLVEKLSVNLKLFAVTMLFAMSFYAGSYQSLIWVYCLLAVWLAQWIFSLRLSYTLFNLANVLYKSMICLWSLSLIISGLFTSLGLED